MHRAPSSLYGVGVRFVAPLVAAATLLPAAGAASTSPSFSFGRVGGNIAPFTVSIAADGAVSSSGPVRLVDPDRVVQAKSRAALLATASRQGFFSLPRRVRCTDTLPDVAGEFVTVRTGPIQKTVTVRGHCRPGFEKLYTALSRAAGVR